MKVHRNQVLILLINLCFHTRVSIGIVEKYTLIFSHIILPGRVKEQIAVNGTIPGPLINITLGNSVELTVVNNIYDSSTILHIHGMLQYRTPFSDGTPLISQCRISNIPGNNSFTYIFTPTYAGTFWYHSHVQLQYSDGMYGPIHVFDPHEREVFANLGSPYTVENSEWTLQFGDWYDVPAQQLLNGYLSPASGGNEPIPDRFTVNNKFSDDFVIEADPFGDPVRVRVINSGTFSMFQFSVDGMPLQLIELDGNAVQPLDLQFIQLNIAQRCSFVLDFTRIATSLANVSAIKIRFKVLGEMYPTYNDTAPYFNIYGTFSREPVNLEWIGLIKFKGRNYPAGYTMPPNLNLPSPPDSNVLEARSLRATRAPLPDYFFYVLVEFYNDAEGRNKAHLNGYTYTPPQIYGRNRSTPILYHYMFGKDNVSDFSSVSKTDKKVIVGDSRTPVIIPYGKCIEMLVNNTDSGEHPFHFHGHQFWIVATNTFPNAATLYKNNYLVRDVVSIPGHGWARLRFKSDNPGAWMFHCHIPWHQAVGFVLNIVVSPSKLRNYATTLFDIPRNQIAACNLPTKRIIKLGGCFNIINPSNQSQFDANQAQSLAAFMMAVDEINQNGVILPNFELQVAVRSGSSDFTGAVNSAEYLAAAAIFSDTNPNRYVSQSNVGVDIVVGARDDVETVAMNQILTGKNLIQVHTVAQDTQLGVGASFPNKIGTLPVDSFQGHVLHMIACSHFQYKDVVIFAINNDFGTASVTEMSKQYNCEWNIHYTFRLSSDSNSFQTEILQAKAMNVEAIVAIFDNPLMSAKFLEQAYNFGLIREGIQIFGTEAMTSSLTWESFQDKRIVDYIMNGYIGIQYDPSYYTKSSEIGKDFIQRFRQRSFSNCSVGTNGIFSLEGGNPNICPTLNLSLLAIDGENMYPYAPHAYDAVYAIAHSLQNMFEDNQFLSINSAKLYNMFLDPSAISFEGVTGMFKVNSGESIYPFVSRGDRNTGQTYKIFNYQPKFGGLALIGKFSDSGIVLCNTTMSVIDGFSCVPPVYNTVNNNPAGNYPPYTHLTTPAVVKIGGLFQLFDSNNNQNFLQAQCLESFIMAIEEVNANPILLPTTTLLSGIESGVGFTGAIDAARALISSKFGGTGVDIVIGSGDDTETQSSSEVFTRSNIIQIHTVSKAVEMSQGSIYPWRLQTTPLASYQGQMLRVVACNVMKLKRIAVFVIDNLFGAKTLADFENGHSTCEMKVVSTSTVVIGQTDFLAAIQTAKQAETRLFLIIFQDPVMAGQLLEQGYNLGLFRQGTAVLGCEEVTTHQTWEAMSKNSDVPSIMKGFIGVRYSAALGMMTNPQGEAFIKNFISRKNTQYISSNGSIECNEGALDDSGDFFLYSERGSAGVVCGGIQFSYFNGTGENIYPYAAHVYDAVYTVAYALQEHFVRYNRTKLVPSLFYNTLVERTNFKGASGQLSFTPGSSYFPHDNRGNRETGHEFIIYNFNELLYHTTFNGSGALGVVGIISPINGTLWTMPDEWNVKVPQSVWETLEFNTIDGRTPVNPDTYIDMEWSLRMGCFVLCGFCLLLVIVFAILTIMFRSVKVIRANRRMFLQLYFGGTFCSVRTFLIGLAVTDSTCIADLWMGHLTFLFLYGALIRQIWIGLLLSSRQIETRKGRKNDNEIRLKSSSSKSILPEYGTSQHSTWDSILRNLMAYASLVITAYLFIATYVGIPHRSSLTSYLNLETTHQYTCSMKTPVLNFVLYAVEALVMIAGNISCVLLSSRMSRDSPLRPVVISSFFISISFIAMMIMTIFGHLEHDSTQFMVAAVSTSSAIIAISLVCCPSFYLIVSIKYDHLMIHEILMNDCTLEKLMDAIEKYMDIIYRVDRYGQNAFRVALEYDVSDELLLELIRFFLPLDPETKVEILSENHGFVWANLVQKDSNAGLVEKICHKYSKICLELANSEDMEGRKAVNIASQACQKIIKESTYFCKRYEIITMDSPVHLSYSCVLHLAIDHKKDGEKVALKMMRNADQYFREVFVRKEAQLSDEFVVEILRGYDVIKDPLYAEEVVFKGFAEYPYCIVMPAADKDLHRIITNEHIAGKDWAQIRSIGVEVAKALQHIHTNGIIHGDVKSKNIVRMGHRVKLVDFDASANIHEDYVGAKFSSAFVPPEMIYFNDKKSGNFSPQSSKSILKTVDSKRVADWKQYSEKFFADDDHIGVKSFTLNPVTGKVSEDVALPYDLVVAHDSFDTWSFGVVLFELCSGIPLFLANSEDNILYENMLDLFAFTDKYKRKRMTEIQNLEARNLVAQMLSKDPRKRPHMSQVLAHPFLSGKKAARMLGEVAEFDVFISYRVQSDLKHAEILYEQLTAAGLKVWWDKRSLVPGVPWKEGFCDGMVKSLVFLPLLSREAINSSSVEKQNFSLLSKSSYCDNVLLEYRLALEFIERGILMNIYPLLIGDFVNDSNGGSYSDYFTSDCHPILSNAVVVESVEHVLQEQLNRLCFGTPLLEDQTVPVILDSIVKNQGCLIAGPQNTSFDTVIKDVVSMVKIQKQLADDALFVDMSTKTNIRHSKEMWKKQSSQLGEMKEMRRKSSILSPSPHNQSIKGDEVTSLITSIDSLVDY